MNGSRFPGVVAARAEGRVLADNAASTQLPLETIERMQAYLVVENSQKGSIFARPLRTSALIAEGKSAFAELIGVPSATVGIGLNATSIAMHLSRTIAPAIRSGDRIVLTAADHSANASPWMWLANFGAEIDIVPVDENGDINEAAYHEALARGPVLVALPWASNCTGTVFDVATYARQAKAVGAIVIVDGVQMLPHRRVDIDPAFDAVMFSAYKIFAPHMGFWYAHPDFAARFFRSDDPLAPTGGSYWSIEPGTQSHEAVAGWLGTVNYLREVGGGKLRAAMDSIATYERDLSKYALEKFEDRAEVITLYGRPTGFYRLPLFAFNVEREGGESVARGLDSAGIEARFGDYYSPRLMQSIASDRGGTAVRLSFAHYNTTADIDRCFAAIDHLISVVVH